MPLNRYCLGRRGTVGRWRGRGAINNITCQQEAGAEWFTRFNPDRSVALSARSFTDLG